MNRSQVAIPDAAWQRRLDQKLKRVGRPNTGLSPRLLVSMLPMILRLRSQLRHDKAAGREPVFNPFASHSPGPYMGVPLGGIGGGSITRGWRGDFRRWQFRPGIYHYQQVFADQFSVYMQQHGESPHVQTLFPGSPKKGELSAWNWNMNPECATYHALFPRAWTIYESPVPNVRLTCRQISPVIPHNYRESSFPVGVFVWTIENLADKPATISLMFTFQNGIGISNDLAGGHYNQPFHITEKSGHSGEHEVIGVALHHTHRQIKALDRGQRGRFSEVYEDPLSFVIAAETRPGVEVSYRTRFVTTGDGADVWTDFADDGRLENVDDAHFTSEGEAIGAGLAITVEMPPKGVEEVTFALGWDMPLVRSGLGTEYHRRYTKFYGVSGNAAPAIARDALINYPSWESEIVAWQNPILNDPELPLWYKTALFNELYYLVDGGTLWVYPAEGEDQRRDYMGHFAYLEGQEYRMYNTYDVHFYASFALCMLWPKLELSLQRDIAQSVRTDYNEQHKLIHSGKLCPRKKRGVVPHDIGSPGEDPWKKVNAYNLHDSNRWKDLNPKFVLQIYRDFIATGDRYFIADVWDAIYEAIEHIKQFDLDGDGLIENEGIPDQTYDVWSATGASAYTGGLWLACLSAAAEMADILGEKEQAEDYRVMYEKGMASYEDKLWNGKYYNYDSSESRHHNIIMADQLAGQWYAKACGLPPVATPEQARSALITIFENNVMRFKNGEMGAINGMMPDGRIDRASIQSQEVWTGTTYALAASMLQEGLEHEAFHTAKGIYDVTYQKRGYWFQTPEAWNEDGDYRSLAYMRPLAIWAIQWAWENIKVHTE
jgi:non-lysosomal glucosylceramidase